MTERSLDISETILINRLPARTWNRLGVNETALTWDNAADLGTERITAAGQTARLEITGSGNYSEKTVEIHALEGQTVTVFEALGAADKLLVRTELHVEKDAAVRLVQIQNTARDSPLRLETGSRCTENGRVKLIQILLGRMALLRYPVHLNRAQFRLLTRENDFARAVPYHSPAFSVPRTIRF